MKLRIRRILSALLVLAMVVSFLPAFDLSIKAAAAEVEEADKTAVYEYYYDISEYRVDTEVHTANNDAKYSLDAVYTEYPAKEGYVFAGWYTERGKTALDASVTSGAAYAKFVPEELMKAVAQVSTTTDYNTASSALRFVAAVESRDYAQVGFLLNKEGSAKTYTHAVTYVYKELSAAVDGGSLTPTYFHSTATHMFALTLTGIKNQGANYTATPFWITHDGTKVDHIPTAKKAVQMGIAANMAAGRTEVEEGYDYSWYTPSATEYTISSVEQMRAFMKLSNTFNFSGKTVKLGADISFNTGIAGDKMLSTGSGIPYINGAVATDPIGSTTVPFAGTFDGQGHTVSGLVSKTGYDGLFAAIQGATIKNVTVSRSTLRAGSGGGCSAGLVGTTFGTCTIENVRIAKDVNLWNATYQGGVVGHNQGHLTIKNTWSGVYVNPQWGSNVYVGGLVGMNANNTSTSLVLENCLYDGSMSGTAQGASFIGGLIGAAGNNPTTTITDCLVTGNLTAMVTSTGTLYIGSLIGSKAWTDSKTVTTDVYAMVESYTNADGAAQPIRADQSFASGVTTVTEANLTGAAAATNAAGLDYALNWATTAATPVLRFADPATAVDTSWYNDTDTEFVIYTAAELNGLAYLTKTNTFSGKTVKLGADIIYNEGDASTWGTTAPANVWTPIGNGDNGFVGTFDGQGHTISGLYYKGGSYASFIARMYGATAKLLNVRIVNSWFESDGTTDTFHNGAGIVGRATNGYTVSGVYTDAYFKGVKSMGIVAFSDAGVTNISNCWNDGTMDASALTRMGTDPGVGGMIGVVANGQTHNITNCLVTATFTGALDDAEYLGGIFGMGAWSAKVKATDCLVAGDMSGVTGGVVGSIAGNNPGGNGSVYTDVYATTETHANLKGAGGATIPVTTVAEADILSDAAATVLTGLDFTAYWSVRENEVPKLGKDNFDISWYDSSKSEFVLYDAADLYGFSYLQESLNFVGKTVKLGADIVLNEGNAADWATTPPANIWEPIGMDDATLAFDGTFDGNGHTISGLYYDSALYGGGLFVYTGTNAVIKNLKIVNSYIRSTHNNSWSATGTFAAFVNGTDFIDLYTDAIIDADSGYVGGIGGRLQGNGTNFTNCEFAGTITGTGANAYYYGGILGGANTNTAGATTYTNCKVSGSVTADSLVGGLAGRSSGAAGSTTTVNGFTLTGTLEATNSSNASQLGGLFGLAEASTVTINNVKTGGTLKPTLGIGGGFIGMVSTANVTIDNSEFSGTITGGTKLAGFVGRVNTAGYTTTIKNSTFDGTITATSTSESTVAGFVANVNNGNVTLQNCEAKGTLVAAGPYAAGAIAQIMNVAGVTIVLDEVIATTDVQCASSNAGGIVGRIMGVNPSVTMSNCLAAATFSTDSWCTSQVVAHAQGNAIKLTNCFFVQTANSAAAGIESSGGSVTHSPVLVSQEIFNYLTELRAGGMHPDYNGFVDGGFVINDAADLYGFNIYSQLSDCAGKTVKLGTDITLNTGDAATWHQTAPALNWLPVGAKNSATKYNGNFDGQGYTISGLYCAYANGNSLGMFRETTGTITNFKLVNSYLANTVDDGYGYNGVIAAYQNGGTISKIYTDAYFHPIDSYAGGIVGFTGGTSATISQCVFDGTMMAHCVLEGVCTPPASGQSRAHANYIGGILGAGTATSTTVSDCIFSGKVWNECGAAHRTGGVVGGLPTAGKAVTITGCFSLGQLGTFNREGDLNSYHFSMIMDGRATGGVPANDATLYESNYILNTPAYNQLGGTINAGSALSGVIGGTSSTVRYTKEQMIAQVETDLADGTTALDFVNVWNFKSGALPTLKWMDTAESAIDIYMVESSQGDTFMSVKMPGATYDQFVDMTIEETPTGQTYTATVNDEEVTLDYLYLEQVNSEAVAFQDIFYGAGTYLSKYTGTTLSAAQNLVAGMKTFGFKEVSTNNINGDCYYTALTFGGNVYTVTHFTTTGETYVSVSSEQKLSPFMDSEYYKTAVNTEGGEPVAETPYTDVTITSVPLDNGGDAFVIRLKNGHYIVIDGGTNRQSDRDRVAAALYDAATGTKQATAENYQSGDNSKNNNPAVVVDAWFFTHAHADHTGLWRGGIYGALQVDVYIKGFYYNFTEKWHVDSQVTVGSETVDGYLNLAYMYADQDTEGVNFYKKMAGDTSEFWTEYTTTHKTAAVVNTPSWGSWGIPIYRVQAGQKFYFDGMTVEVPYTQEQVQPSEMNLDLNGTCSWFLLTDDYGHTFLDAGDAEAFNAEAVAELYSDSYKLFGADIGKTFHHGLNPLVKHTGTFGETPGASTAGNYDYTLVDQFYGINSAYGDGNQTKFVFITHTAGSWAQITGYNNKGGSQRDLSIHEMYYLFGYILPNTWGGKIRDYVGWGYATVDTKIPFAAYGGTYTSGTYTDTFEGQTTVTMNESGITWDKYHTNGIYD